MLIWLPYTAQNHLSEEWGHPQWAGTSSPYRHAYRPSVTVGCAKWRIKANQDTSYAREFLERTHHVAYAAFKLTL